MRMLPTELTGADRAAYDALFAGVVALERPDVHHLEFTGPKAGEVITGLVTNHVLGLAVGAGQYAATLTAKGKIVADLRIVRTGAERFLTTAREPGWAGWRDLVRKYVNPRLARYAEPSFGTLSLFGPLAAATAEHALATVGATPAEFDAAGPADTAAAPHADDPSAPYACTRYLLGEQELFRITSPELGEVAGVDLVAPLAMLEALRDVLARDAAVVAGTDGAIDVARIEAGRPRWGRDMDDSTIPQEANLGQLGALHFDKGCYTGQETVARIHFRGHVNRHLRVLRSEGAIPTGAELRTAEGKVVGDVRSSAVSPRMGPVALAMVRREVEPGATLEAVVEGHEPLTVTVER
jgi:folate-binding protein YgfZ